MTLRKFIDYAGKTPNRVGEKMKPSVDSILDRAGTGPKKRMI